VGGIQANSTHPAEFIDENLAIQTNIIRSAYRHGVTKLLSLGSACIYPRETPKPIKEEDLLSGALEPTNEAYAIAKIAALVMCRSYRRQYGARFISAMPTNLYGPGDNFDLETSHVVPALLRRFHEAHESGSDVVLWGTGSARREFLHVDDAAEAFLLLMHRYEGDDPNGFLNVGLGEDVSIRELTEIVARVVGYEGEVSWDTSRPDGTPKRQLDIGRIRELGWAPKRDLEKGLRDTYAWYRESLVNDSESQRRARGIPDSVVS
jgi:GDP-L-fucose synthase